MKTPDEIVAHLAHHIGLLYYHRPLMYGGSGNGVEIVLHDYHQIWAEVVERYDEFRQTWWRVLEEEDCGAANFSHRYSMNHPGASEEEIAKYVCAQWRKVSDRLGVPIPHAALKQEFDERKRQLDELNRQTKQPARRNKKAASRSAQRNKPASKKNKTQPKASRKKSGR